MLIETARVVITVAEADLAAIDAGVSTDAEVFGHERGAVSLQNAVTLEESALGHARVHLLGLSDHDGFVFEVVEDGDLPDAVVLEAALNDMLLEVALEAQYLLVELNEGGLKLLLDISAGSSGTEVIRVLNLGQRRALFVLSGSVRGSGNVGDHVHRCRLVLHVSDLVKVDVRDLFVRWVGRVVRGCIPRQLGEVL